MKKIFYIIIGFSLGFCSLVYGATVLFPSSGGTGWSYLTPNTVLLGNGYTRLSTTTPTGLLDLMNLSPLTVGSITATSTTGTSQFQGFVNVGNPSGVFVDYFGGGYGHFTVEENVNDIAGINIGNISTGVLAGVCYDWYNANTLKNTAYGANKYFAASCFSGPNFGAFSGLPPNSLATIVSDGSMAWVTSTTSKALQTMAWGLGTGYTTANYDMVFTANNTTLTPKLGIGTSSPWAKLSVAGVAGSVGGLFTISSSTVSSTSTVLMIDSNGLVGIGTSTPTNKLSVIGNIDLGDATNAIIKYASTVTANGSNLIMQPMYSGTTMLSLRPSASSSVPPALRLTDSNTDASGAHAFSFGTGNATLPSNSWNFYSTITGVANGDSWPINFGVSSVALGGRVTIMTIANNGNVGIGTTTPNNELDIYSTTKSAIGFSGASGNTYKWTMGMNVSNGGRFSIASSTALGTNDVFVINGAGNVGIATTSPQWPFTSYSTGGPQLSLSAGAGIPQWTFRNAGGNLYLSTTTVAGTATTTSWAFKIDGTTGMTSFHQPSAQLSSGVSQVCTNVNTAYPLTFDYNDYINTGITHSTTVNNATTTINYAGTYEIIFSTIASTDAGTGHIGIWLNVNNTNVASSSTYVELPAIAETIITAPIIYSFSANDQFQLRMACDNAGSFTVNTASGGLGGVMPASPSTKMTIKRISQ